MNFGKSDGCHGRPPDNKTSCGRRSAEASSSATNVHAVLANERQGFIQTGVCHKFFWRAGSSIFESWGAHHCPRSQAAKSRKESCCGGALRHVWKRSLRAPKCVAPGRRQPARRSPVAYTPASRPQRSTHERQLRASPPKQWRGRSPISRLGRKKKRHTLSMNVQVKLFPLRRSRSGSEAGAPRPNCRRPRRANRLPEPCEARSWSPPKFPGTTWRVVVRAGRGYLVCSGLLAGPSSRTWPPGRTCGLSRANRPFWWWSLCCPLPCRSATKHHCDDSPLARTRAPPVAAVTAQSRSWAPRAPCP
jgi:hypothetical protein